MPASPLPALKPIDDALSLIKRTNEVLRWEILEGKLAPGARIRETEVAEQLGVSRPVVREALHRLAFLGLVDIRDRRGARVVTLSESELADVMDFQTMVFSLVCRLAAENGTPEQLKAFRTAAQSLHEATVRGDLDTLRGYTVERLRVQRQLTVCSGYFYRVNQARSFVSEVQHPYVMLAYRTPELRRASPRRWVNLSKAVSRRDPALAEAMGREINTDIRRIIMEGYAASQSV